MNIHGKSRGPIRKETTQPPEFAKFNLKKITITGAGVKEDWLIRCNTKDYRNDKYMER